MSVDKSEKNGINQSQVVTIKRNATNLCVVLEMILDRVILNHDLRSLLLSLSLDLVHYFLVIFDFDLLFTFPRF